MGMILWNIAVVCSFCMISCMPVTTHAIWLGTRLCCQLSRFIMVLVVLVTGRSLRSSAVPVPTSKQRSSKKTSPAPGHFGRTSEQTHRATCRKGCILARGQWGAMILIGKACKASPTNHHFYGYKWVVETINIHIWIYGCFMTLLNMKSTGSCESRLVISVLENQEKLQRCPATQVGSPRHKKCPPSPVGSLVVEQVEGEQTGNHQPTNVGKYPIWCFVMLYLFCWSLVWYFFAFHPKGSDDDFKVKKLFFGSDATKQLILGHLGPTCLSPAAGNAFHRVRLWFAASQALLLCPTEALKGFEIIWDRGDQNPSCAGIVHISRYVSLVTSYAHQKAASSTMLQGRAPMRHANMPCSSAGDRWHGGGVPKIHGKHWETTWF